MVRPVDSRRPSGAWGVLSPAFPGGLPGLLSGAGWGSRMPRTCRTDHLSILMRKISGGWVLNPHVPLTHCRRPGVADPALPCTTMHYHAIAVPIRAVLLVTLTKRECSPALPRARARGYLPDRLVLRLIV